MPDNLHKSESFEVGVGTGEKAPLTHARAGNVEVDPAELDAAERPDVLDTPFMRRLAKCRPSYYSAALRWRPMVLSVLPLRPFLALACEQVGVSFSAFVLHRQKDVIFDDAVRLALGTSKETLEQSAWKDGVEGYEKPVYQGGAMVGTILERSDAMRGKLMEGHIPEKYAKAKEISITGAIGIVPLTQETAAELVLRAYPELMGRKEGEA